VECDSEFWPASILSQNASFIIILEIKSSSPSEGVPATKKVLVKMCRRSVDDLVDIFRGKLDDTRSFLDRVMSCRSRNPDIDRSDVVIPYRSVIEFYLKETQYLKDSEAEQERFALKRKRGPVSEESVARLCVGSLRKLGQRKSVAVKKWPPASAKSLKKLCESWPDGYLILNRAVSLDSRALIGNP
jgi:hypothetical protein